MIIDKGLDLRLPIIYPLNEICQTCTDDQDSLIKIEIFNFFILKMVGDVYNIQCRFQIVVQTAQLYLRSDWEFSFVNGIGHGFCRAVDDLFCSDV